MKKLLIFILVFTVFAGCKKDVTTLNVDPKSPPSVPSYTLFTNAQRTLARTIASPNVNLNIFRLIEQYWTETTYTDESNYDLQTRQIPRGIWNALYRDVLRDFLEARTLIPNDVLDPTTQKNQLAVIDVMEVYTWYYLVTTYGDIPYTEALNIENAFPKYDSQASIFADLLKRLDADIAAFDITGESLGNADIIYSGDVASWKKFAASFKLKIGMTLSDVDAAASKTIVESAIAAGIFSSSADDAVFKFLSGPPNTNPVWEDLVQSGRKDFVGTSTIIDTMMFLNDPRLPLYFTPDASGAKFSGGTVGASNNYTAFSKPSTTLSAPDYPVSFLTFSEIEFYLAEAKERAYNVPGTAVEHYNAAITSSILSWEGSLEQATAYLAQPRVSYASEVGNFKQKIGFQKWLALYNRAWDAWIEQRRLDAPTLPAPDAPVTDFPVRFTYSIDEQNINTTNYNAASKAIGSDEVTTKLYWDKF